MASFLYRVQILSRETLQKDVNGSSVVRGPHRPAALPAVAETACSAVACVLYWGGRVARAGSFTLALAHAAAPGMPG